MKNILVGLTCMVFAGCSSMQIEDFNNTTPEFVPQTYFNGHLRAYGVVKGIDGKIIKSFKGDLVGSWDTHGVGTLDEHFVYSDGTKQERIWKLQPTNDAKKFIGTAGDIVGEAPMVANGNTVMIDYVMRVPYKDSTIDINVRDWLHLVQDGVIVNHSKMKKFGVQVGELVITIIKD